MVVAGIYLLVRWIPSNTNTNEIRTDFYSARLCFWMTAIGLLILFLWSISALTLRSFMILKLIR